MQSSPDFAAIIRQRRRQLDLTQEQLARRVATSVPYIGHLEANKRHPSEKVVVKLAKVLGLDARELFLLANPETKLLVSEKPKSGDLSTWEAFARDKTLRELHKISDQEMETLSQVALMGDVRSPQDFVFILKAIREALGSWR